MKTYRSTEEILHNLPYQNESGYFYYDREKWKENPQNTKIIFIAEEDEMELIELELDDLLLIAYENNMQRFFEPETLLDIISVQQRNKPDSTIDYYIRAINHYAKFDTFLSK